MDSLKFPVIFRRIWQETEGLTKGRGLNIYATLQVEGSCSDDIRAGSDEVSGKATWATLDSGTVIRKATGGQKIERQTLGRQPADPTRST